MKNILRIVEKRPEVYVTKYMEVLGSEIIDLKGARIGTISNLIDFYSRERPHLYYSREYNILNYNKKPLK